MARLLLPLVALLAFTACAGDVLVKLPVHEPAPDSPLAAVPPTPFTVSVAIADGATIGGRRTTIGNSDMGAVDFAVDPRETLADLFIAELESAGHVLAREGENGERRLDVTIYMFAARTPATALYWDVTGELRTTLESTGAHYEVTVTDRTYGNPGRGISTRRAKICLQRVAAQCREDPDVAAFLRGE